MLMIVFLLVSSLAWGGVIWLCARALQRSNVSGRARQWIWRGATMLLIAPWVSAPLVAAFGWGLAPGVAAVPADAMTTTLLVMPQEFLPAVEGVSAPIASTPISLDPLQIILIVLAAGWVVRFVMAQLAARSLLGIVHYAPEAGPGFAQNAARTWSRRLGMKRAPRLLVVAENFSPFSYGVLRPTICLPEGLEAKLKAEALDLVIAHESTHVARGDGWLRPLERITADVLWFNPFAWAMRRELDVARELACDEAVLKVARDGRVYARTLRDIAGFSAGLPAAVPAASMSLAGRSMMLRVTRTLGLADRKPARLAIVSAFLLALVGAPLAVAQVMFATPAPEAPPAPKAPVAPEAPKAPEVELAFEHPPEAPEFPEALEAPEPPEAPAAAELSSDGTVRATFPAKVVAANGDASRGYAVRLQGTGEAASCVAHLNGFGSLSVSNGQAVAEGDAIGRRSEGRQMRFSVQCADGDAPHAFIAPPAPPVPRSVAAVAPVPAPAPYPAPRPFAAPQSPQAPTWTSQAPPAPPTPVTPPSGVSPVAPVAPVAPPAPPHRIANAPNAIVVAPARLTSAYGERVDPFNGKRVKHEGVDIAARRGADIHAPGQGRVVFAGTDGTQGNVVEMNVSGYSFRFSHLDEIKVQQGQGVSAGTVVGTMGSSGQATGPHVHVEVRMDGLSVDPASVNGLVLIAK